MRQVLIFKAFLINAWFILFSFLIPELFLVVLSLVQKLLSSYDFLGFRSEIVFILYIIVLIVALYLVYQLFSLLKKIKKSKRWDLGASLLVGALFFITKNHVVLGEFIGSIDPNLICFVLIICFFVGLAGWMFFENRFFKRDSGKPFFLSDNPQLPKNQEEDLLGFKELAQDFSKKILNNDATDNIVFGLDAPWGAGKTTFLEFIKSYWKEEKGNDIITFDFKPSFFTGDNLLETFSRDLRAHLNEEYYFPELQSLLADYLKVIKGISFGNISFDFAGSISSSSAIECLNDQFSYLGNKKVVVIIDDLDRLNMLEIKQVLNLVKKVFNLPNITFILCYDTQNINAYENLQNNTLHTVNIENETSGVGATAGTKAQFQGNILSLPIHSNTKIAEYFEKIVNLKISLFPNPQKLKDFMLASLPALGLEEIAVRNYAEHAFSYIFDPKNYHHYRPFLGDIRKIKRFLNTLKLFGRFDIDFTIYDYHPKDLINLMLIYINYPQIFRKIYDTETNGGKGFFSLLSPYDISIFSPSDNVKVYKNSGDYHTYLKTLDEDQKFLVKEVFDVSVLEDSNYENVDPETKKTRACFNGTLGTGRNLETNYLSFIVQGGLPELGINHRFFKSVITQINDPLANLSFQEVISKNQTNRKLFLFDNNGEADYQNLFTVISESPRTEFGYGATQKTLDYILESLPAFSLVGDEKLNIGLRDDFIYTLIRLLDRGGWKGGVNQFADNSKENVVEIADRIFGDNKFNKYSGKGILDAVSNPERGPLGIYDLMLFRLLCNQDRQGSLYNVYNALAYHADQNTGINGVIRDLVVNQMREISQKTFAIFQERYITPDKNFIEDVYSISDEEIFGKSKDYFYKNTELDKEGVKAKVEIMKNRMVTFILYQLTNKVIQNGIGCGAYSIIGEDDSGEIFNLMNDYILKVFRQDPIWFIRYLAPYINFTTPNGVEDKAKPFLDKDIWSVLDKEKFKIYWRENEDVIKETAGKMPGSINTVHGKITKNEIVIVLEGLNKDFQLSLPD